MTWFVWNLKLKVFQPSDNWKYFLDIFAMNLKGSYRGKWYLNFFVDAKTSRSYMVNAMKTEASDNYTVCKLCVRWAMFTIQWRRTRALIGWSNFILHASYSQGHHPLSNYFSTSVVTKIVGYFQVLFSLFVYFIVSFFYESINIFFLKLMHIPAHWHSKTGPFTSFLFLKFRQRDKAKWTTSRKKGLITHDNNFIFSFYL